MDRPGEWELAESWVERWRSRMAACPDEPGGFLCCVAWWDVGAPQEALDELPAGMLAGSGGSLVGQYPPNPRRHRTGPAASDCEWDVTVPAWPVSVWFGGED